MTLYLKAREDEPKEREREKEGEGGREGEKIKEEGLFATICDP